MNVPCPVDNVAKDAQRRQRAREQLLRVNQRKKEEKIATLTTKLTVLTQQLESQFTFDPDEYQLLLEEGGFSSVEELQSEIANVKEYIATEQEKLTNVMKNLAGGGQVGEAVDGATEEPSEEWLDSLRERKKVYTYIHLYIHTYTYNDIHALTGVARAASYSSTEETRSWEASQCSFSAKNENHLSTRS